ncbi:MAG TPA: histidine phosphatase family protein [Streptosporangiaceae bacterium]|jgi:probable phosphoglycerate mutase
MTVVHWARHGENVANLSGTFSYRVFDGDLTDRGIAQAQQLADRLHAATDVLGLLVCSPLRRARQTAQVVSGRLGLPVAAELEDLREVNVGELDGRADDGAWRVYEATLAAWRSGQLSQRFPGGESGDELAARIRRALLGIAARSGSADAVVIAHGASIRAALPTLTGQPDPGRDLATGDVARLSVICGDGSAARIALTAWA